MNAITQARIALNQSIRDSANGVYDGLGDKLTSDIIDMPNVPDYAFATGLAAGAIAGLAMAPPGGHPALYVLCAGFGGVAGEVALGATTIGVAGFGILADWKCGKPRTGWDSYAALIGEKNANDVPQYRAWKEQQ